MNDDCFYSDMFKGTFAKLVASALNGLCEQGRLVLFSTDEEILGWYPFNGTEFQAREVDGDWYVHGVPLSYCRFVKEGPSGTVKCMTWGGEVIFSLPCNNCVYFREGMDFDSFITISH